MAQVQGEEIYLAHSGQEVDDNIDEVQAARGSEASLSARLEDIVEDFEADQQRQETEIGVVAALGAKNSLKMDNAAGYTLTTHGRTFEVLADGGIKITGDTPDSSYADFYVSGTWGGREPILNSSEENCILSFYCSDALQTNDLYIRAVDRRTGSTANTATARLNQEAEFNFPITAVLITVQPSVVLPTEGITVYPMIRNSAIKDSAFSPYAPTNRELYELCETKASLNDIYGIKNQLPNGTDLNNLSAGIMMCPGATVAATLINCPTTTDAFIIYTDYLAASSRVIQRIYSFSTTTGIPAQYMRVRWSQGWTPWYQVMMQSVASAQSAASLMQAGRLDAELTDAGNDEEEEER